MQNASPLRILLIEDNPADADLVRELLGEAPGRKFVVQQVPGLRAAAEKLKEQSVDAILLDLNLPEARGVETVRKALALPTNAPLVVLSGVLDDRVRMQVLQEGAQDAIAKDEPTAKLLARAVLYSLERHHVARRSRQIEELVAATPDAVIVVDHEGVVRFVNKAAEALFGTTRDDLIGELLGFSVSDGRAAEIELITGSGPRMGEMRVARFDWEGSPAYLASIRDVTAEYQLRIELDAAQAQLHHTLASSAAILCAAPITAEGLTSGEFAFSLVTEGVEHILGFTAEEAQASGWWMHHVHPDDLGGVLRAVPRILAAGGGEAEYRLQHKDETYRWVRAHLSVNNDDAGRPAELIAVLIDVTDRKDLERQFQAAQRMEAVGILAGGIAHDFNNLLTAMFAYADSASALLPDGHAAAGDVKELRRVSDRAAALTRQLLAFSRQQVLEPSVISLNDVAASTSKLLHRLISEDVKLVVALAPEIHSVYADPGQMEQIIVNLAVNARDAMPEGGTLTMETENAHLDEDYAQQHPDVTPGDFAVLTISDTGTGMDEESKTRLFEPFYTTKEAGRGTGLGLATVYGIVKQSQGHIWVYSELGRGTVFKIYLPRDERVAADLEEVREDEEVRGGGETILFVEDDDAVRLAGAEALRRQGYRVLVAEDGRAALDLVEGGEDDFDLLITDVVMPRLGGRILAQKVRALVPNTRILFTSGYSREAVVTHGILASNSTFLQKPYSPILLGRRVREILDG